MTTPTPDEGEYTSLDMMYDDLEISVARGRLRSLLRNRRTSKRRHDFVQRELGGFDPGLIVGNPNGGFVPDVPPPVSDQLVVRGLKFLDCLGEALRCFGLDHDLPHSSVDDTPKATGPDSSPSGDQPGPVGGVDYDRIADIVAEQLGKPTLTVADDGHMASTFKGGMGSKKRKVVP